MASNVFAESPTSCFLAQHGPGGIAAPCGQVRGCPRKRADLIGGFRREDVLKLASLLLDFRFAVHSEAVGEKPLRQTVTANDVSRSLSPARREFDDHAAVPDRNPARL